MPQMNPNRNYSLSQIRLIRPPKQVDFKQALISLLGDFGGKFGNKASRKQ
ncbi:hypothetical protein COLO4_38001 [Corchorus olitorius]|uniref:Uncharacterized protein n=1 Tax=Corchorus olitorius TaxID=93759 RepID=A0A1R3FXK0_9ROSI|nr:hypothetical protein COLO4_38001 [Corchorus olitorius]